MSDFYLIYQPKIQNNIVVGLEALLRPVDTTQNVFEYLARVTNTVALDLMVMKRCQEDLAQFDIRIPVSINIHPSSLLNDSFLFTAIEQLKNKNIILELVEHQGIELNDKFLNSVSILQQNQIKMSIDDFGKDFARADLALTIGADEVKFDRSLVRDIETNYCKFKHLSFLYSKMTTLCTKRVVFEGVETLRQKELIELFAENPIIQGFYFYKPMPLEDIIQLDGFLNQVDEIKTEEPHQLGLDLDYKLYTFLAENDVDSLHDDAVNDFIKQNDVLGLVHAQDVNVTLKNLREIYFNHSSPISNGMMSLVDSTEKLVVIRNEQGVVMYDNAAHRELVGTSIVGIDPNELTRDNYSYRQCLEKDRDFFGDNELMFHKDKEVFDGVEFETIREKMVYNGKQFIITKVCPLDVGLMDVNKDELTKCYTRSILQHRLTSYENRIVAFIDMNGFKVVNDSYGHRFGDTCLGDFAAILRTSLRKQDLVIRYGGDEFVIIFDSSAKTDIEKRLDSLNEKIRRYFEIKGYDLSFTYGLSQVSDQDIFAAIEVADRNMYAAKRQMKNA